MVWHYISEKKLDPDLFWVSENGPSFSLHLRSSTLMFEFEHAPFSFHLFRYRYKGFQPGSPLSDWIILTQESVDYQYYDFDVVAVAYMKWFKDHVFEYLEEQNSPDEWAQFSAYEAMLDWDESSEESSRPFTEEEKENIRLGLHQYRLYIVEHFSPTEEQLAQISKRLDFLSKA
jgi:hypothetical protein